MRANLTHNIQQWEINLTDVDGDGVWEGVLNWRPEETGRPSLKLIARDGEGQSASVDIVTRTLTVEEVEPDQRALFLALGTTSFLGIIGLLAFMITRRRRAMAEIDLIASWDAFNSAAFASSAAFNSAALASSAAFITSASTARFAS